MSMLSKGVSREETDMRGQSAMDLTGIGESYGQVGQGAGGRIDGHEGVSDDGP